jgi:hypothetical protein
MNAAATPSRAAALRARLAPHAIGLSLALAYVALLVRTARNLGFARDEGFYFAASTSYARWFDLLLRDRPAALTRAAIDQAWGINHEHPGADEVAVWPLVALPARALAPHRPREPRVSPARHGDGGPGPVADVPLRLPRARGRTA